MAQIKECHSSLTNQIMETITISLFEALLKHRTDFKMKVDRPGKL